MGNILEINNWNQLVRAKSENYPNLKILVTQYTSQDLTGTKISIVDYTNNDTYLVIFAQDIQSTLIPASASITQNQVIEIINSYGFNVTLSQPIVLQDDVITLLKGLYTQGYRYVYKDYMDPRNILPYGIYASAQIEKRKCDLCISRMPGFVEDYWDWCLPLMSYAISDLIENGTVDNGSNG